mgnify:CR=1 FL=1
MHQWGLLTNMKKLLILLFSLLISFNSYGEWVKVTEDLNGNNYYLDFEKVKKIDGYHYFWRLVDLFKPDKYGDLSYIGHIQVDCKFSRSMGLSEFYYSLPMGKGRLTTNNIENPEWSYPPPGSMSEFSLNTICDYVK